MRESSKLVSPYHEMETPKQASYFWPAFGKALSQAGIHLGKAVASLGQQAGQSLKDAYFAIDPDVRRHLAQMPFVGLSALTPRHRKVEAIADDGHRPIVFVHGLAGHPGNFGPMQLYFRAMGRKRTYSVGFDNKQSLEEMANDLSEVIEKITAVNQLHREQTIDLVAHSMGGLVSRLALTNPNTASRVAHLVTLGTPHQGTHLARLASTPQTIQLRPNSRVFQKLKAQEPWPPSMMPRLTALWSPSDIMILPAEGATLPGADNLMVEGFTHFTFLLHPQSWQRILETIRIK